MLLLSLLHTPLVNCYEEVEEWLEEAPTPEAEDHASLSAIKGKGKGKGGKGYGGYGKGWYGGYGKGGKGGKGKGEKGKDNKGKGKGKDGGKGWSEWVERRECHTCGIVGHISRDCPKKKANSLTEAAGQQ